MSTSRWPGELEEQAAPSLTCPCCGLTSYNPKDLAELYCARCKLFLHDAANEILAREMPFVEQVICKHFEMRFIRHLADGRFVGVSPMMPPREAYLRLCVANGYVDSWLYQDRSCAINADVWDPVTQLEPFGWYRHPATGRRRSHGNLANEYIRP